jgi:hypothetical protein
MGGKFKRRFFTRSPHPPLKREEIFEIFDLSQ